MEENDNSHLSREDKILSELRQVKNYLQFFWVQKITSERKILKRSQTKAASELVKMQRGGMDCFG